MFLPYAHDQAIRRVPWVTITIVALNLALFVTTRIVLAERDLGSVEEATRRLYEAQASAYQEHVHSIRDRRGARPDEHPLPWDAFLEALPRGEVPGVTPAKQERWAAAKAHLERVERGSTDLNLDLVFGKGFRPWQLVTHLFMHGGWGHLAGNMWFFVLCAPALEYRYGARMFVVLYLVGGWVAAASMLPALAGSNEPLLGASGAVAACMGAFFVRHWNAKVKFLWVRGLAMTSLRWGELWMPAWLLIGLWLAEQLMYASVQGAIGVAVTAHLGGFAYGAAFAYVLKRVGWEKRLFERRLASGGETSPDDPDTDMAVALARSRAWRDASGYCLRALEAHPGHPVLLAIHAQSLAHVGEIDVARAALATAIEKARPAGPSEHLLDAAKALAERLPALGLDPVSGMVLARWFEDNDEPAEALWAYRDVADSTPDHALAPKALYRLGELHVRKLDRPDLGANAFRAFLERYPGHPLAPSVEHALRALPAARPASIPLPPQR